MCRTGDGRRQGGYENVLGKHLARTLFGEAVDGEGVEVAAVKVDLPRLTEHRGEVCFELRELVLEVIAN